MRIVKTPFFEKIPLLQIGVAGGFFQFGHYDTPSYY